MKTTIYDLVFTFPKAGLLVQTKLEYIETKEGSKTLPCTSFRLTTRSYDTEFSFASFGIKAGRRNAAGSSSRSTTICRTKNLCTILTPLLTSKQFYHEAKASFYSQNYFYVPSIKTLHSMLLNIPPHRLQFIRHLAFDYSGKEKEAISVFRILRKIGNVNSLDIKILGDKLLPGSKVPGKKGARMQGLGSLSFVRGLKRVSVEAPEEIKQLVEKKLVHATTNKVVGRGEKRTAADALDDLQKVANVKKAKKENAQV